MEQIVPTRNSNAPWSLTIGFLIIAVATLHYSTPIKRYHLHELYRIFFYIPIILAVYRYQVRGGICSALIISAIYLPHVVFQWGGDFWFNFSRFLEMIMYLVIGIVAGILAQRELNERIKYQRTAMELQEMYKKLKNQSEKLTEIEEQLLHSDRLSVLGELSANLAHEVRNPLGSIWGVVEILKDKCHTDKESIEFMEILLKEVRRLNEVVENYLALARKPQIQRKKCNLQEIVQSVFHLVESKARKQHIHFKIIFPGQPFFIQADENQLRQILINLILNSMTAITNSGNITVKAEQKVDEQDQTVIFLSIADSGGGIDAGVLEKMFKPFFTTKDDGTGLGLSIVKRIVDQNKWKINVDSAKGRGTTFTLIFPVEEKNA